MSTWTGSCANATALTIPQPPFLNAIHDSRACVVSSNLTTSATTQLSILSIDSDSGGSSTFQTCCGIDSAVASFSERNAGGTTCGFTYCNVTDQAAANGFMACLNATAKGVQGQCFLSAATSPSGDSTSQSNGAGRGMAGENRKLVAAMGVLTGLALGISGWTMA
jgi:hypothetical protein